MPRKSLSRRDTLESLVLFEILVLNPNKRCKVVTNIALYEVNESKGLKFFDLYIESTFTNVTVALF